MKKSEFDTDVNDSIMRSNNNVIIYDYTRTILEIM